MFPNAYFVISSILHTHRESRQGALVPEFVLRGVVFTLCPMGGTDEAIHQEGNDHLRHLVHQLGDYQQRR